MSFCWTGSDDNFTTTALEIGHTHSPITLQPASWGAKSAVSVGHPRASGSRLLVQALSTLVIWRKSQHPSVPWLSMVMISLFTEHYSLSIHYTKLPRITSRNTPCPSSSLPTFQSLWTLLRCLSPRLTILSLQCKLLACEKDPERCPSHSEEAAHSQKTHWVTATLADGPSGLSSSYLTLIPTHQIFPSLKQSPDQ